MGLMSLPWALLTNVEYDPWPKTRLVPVFTMITPQYRCDKIFWYNLFKLKMVNLDPIV